MTTLIVSDVHLGSGYNRAGELATLLGGGNFGRLIILGDLFDKPHTVRLRESEWDLLDTIRNLSRSKEIIWVEGNHDEGLSDVITSLLDIRAEKEYLWSHHGKRLLAVHGHQFDIYSRDKSCIASCAGFLYSVLRRIDLIARTDIFHRLCFENRSWKRSSDMVKEWALEYGADKGADIMFCGHTHRAESDKKHGVEYVNTGCWNDRYCHYAIVDGGGARLREFTMDSMPASTRVGLAVNQRVAI